MNSQTSMIGLGGGAVVALIGVVFYLANHHRLGVGALVVGLLAAAASYLIKPKTTA